MGKPSPPRTGLLADLKAQVRSWGVVVLLLALALGVWFFVDWAARTRGQVRDWKRYSIAFTDIDCPPPPGEERVEFLTEVRYLAEMPATLRILDENLAERLAKAFA